MGRNGERGLADGSGEDRLSAVMAATLVAANLVGGGLLVLLKALDVPPMAPGRVASREALAAWIGPARSADPAAIPAPAVPPSGVAGLAPEDRSRRHR